MLWQIFYYYDPIMSRAAPDMDETGFLDGYPAPEKGCAPGFAKAECVSNREIKPRYGYDGAWHDRPYPGVLTEDEIQFRNEWRKEDAARRERIRDAARREAFAQAMLDAKRIMTRPVTVDANDQTLVVETIERRDGQIWREWVSRRHPDSLRAGIGDRELLIRVDGQYFAANGPVSAGSILQALQDNAP